MIANFWWGEKEGEMKLHWLSWDRMSKAKCNVGMGFKGVLDFNKAMIRKQ